MANAPSISLAPTTFFDIGPFPITSATMAMAATSVILLIIAILVRRKAGVVPTRAQMAFELVISFMLEKMEIAFGSQKRARKFAPLILTIFLFLLVANQFMLLPFVESIVTEEGISLFRAASSHYSLPMALTIFLVILSHIIALTMRPIKHIGNFIKIGPIFKIKSIKELPMAILEFFLGLLDIIGELAKVASLSTRLFGNMFAGSIIVAIISSLAFATQFLIPIPFIALGILSGFVQAFVFSMLGTIYLSSMIDGVEEKQTLEATT